MRFWTVVSFYIFPLFCFLLAIMEEEETTESTEFLLSKHYYTNIITVKKTYFIQKIPVPIFKMLVKELLCSESFLAEATAPLINIKMNLMLLLLPKHVIIRMKSTLAWEVIFLFFHKWHQILHETESVRCNYACRHAAIDIELLYWMCYLVNSFPSCTAPFPWAMHHISVWILKTNSGIKWNMPQTLHRNLKSISRESNSKFPVAKATGNELL